MRVRLDSIRLGALNEFIATFLRPTPKLLSLSSA
jgi:hypothetical protein